MDQAAYSENELEFNFGQFNEKSVNYESVSEKLARFARLPMVQENGMTEKDKMWSKLFTRYSNTTATLVSDNIKSVGLEMDISNLGNGYTIEDIETSCDEKSSHEELATLIVEKCLASKLKSLPESIQKSLVEELDKVKASTLKSVLSNAWAGLNSDAAKMAFCVLFTCNPKLCKALCVHVLLPWMSERVPNKLEELSKILSKEGDIVCQYLIAPLLQVEDGPLVKDILSLEDLLSAMSRKQCSTLLKVLICDAFELQQWNVPILALILENANPTNEDLQNIINLVSGTGAMFAQSRDFGALLVSVANSIKPGSDSIVSQMNVIVNNYKGSLKFKALKILSDLSG